MSKMGVIYHKILLFSVSILILSFLSNSVAAQNCSATQNLPNFGCVSPNLYRGVQPTEECFKELAKLGVKTIVNLRSNNKRSRTEEEWAKNAGLTCVNFPTPKWSDPKDAEIQKLLALMDASYTQPIFIHCKHGADRTVLLTAFYRISHDKLTS